MSHDGKLILWGIIRKDRARSYLCVAYQLKERTFIEFTFDQSINEFDFELSVPDATALYDIDEKYRQTYRIKNIETSKSSTSSNLSSQTLRSSRKIIELDEDDDDGDDIHIETLFMEPKGKASSTSTKKRTVCCEGSRFAEIKFIEG